MLSREATNTNFIVFGLTRPGLVPTIYHIRDEHANHYTTDAAPNRGMLILTNGCHRDLVNRYGISVSHITTEVPFVVITILLSLLVNDLSTNFELK